MGFWGFIGSSSLPPPPPHLCSHNALYIMHGAHSIRPRNALETCAVLTAGWGRRWRRRLRTVCRGHNKQGIVFCVYFKGGVPCFFLDCMWRAGSKAGKTLAAAVDSAAVMIFSRNDRVRERGLLGAPSETAFSEIRDHTPLSGRCCTGAVVP